MSVLIDFYAGDEDRMVDRFLRGAKLAPDDYQYHLDWQQCGHLDAGSPTGLDALADAIAAVTGKIPRLFSEVSRDLNDEKEPPPEPSERWPSFIVAESWVRSVAEVTSDEIPLVVGDWATRIGESIGPGDVPPDLLEALQSLVDFCDKATTGELRVLFRVC